MLNPTPFVTYTTPSHGFVMLLYCVLPSAFKVQLLLSIKMLVESCISNTFNFFNDCSFKRFPTWKLNSSTFFYLKKKLNKKIKLFICLFSICQFIDILIKIFEVFMCYLRLLSQLLCNSFDIFTICTLPVKAGHQNMQLDVSISLLIWQAVLCWQKCFQWCFIF